MADNVTNPDAHYFSIQESFENLDLSISEGKKKRIVKEREASTSAETSTNRRFSLRPRKRSSASINNNNNNSEDEELVNIYNSENKRPKLDHNSKRKISHLETIFEEPIVNKRNGSLKLMGATKVKRSITFYGVINKTKSKIRKAQIKKLNSGKTNSAGKRAKLTLNDLQSKLGELDPSNS